MRSDEQAKKQARTTPVLLGKSSNAHFYFTLETMNEKTRIQKKNLASSYVRLAYSLAVP